MQALIFAIIIFASFLTTSCESASKSEKYIFEHEITALAFSADSKTLFIADSSNTVGSWHLGSRRFKAMAHCRSRGMALAKDGSIILLDNPNSLSVIRTGNCRKLYSYKFEDPAVSTVVKAVAIAPDNKAAVLVWLHGNVSLWNFSAGKMSELITTMSLRFSKAFVDVSGDGNFALIGYAKKGVISIYDLSNGKAIHSIQTGKKGTRAAAFLPKNDSVIHIAKDNTLSVWKIKEGEKILSLKGKGVVGVNVMAVVPAGDLVISGQNDGSIAVWNLSTGETQIWNDAHDGYITALAASLDGHRFASGSADKRVKIWNLPLNEVPYVIQAGN